MANLITCIRILCGLSLLFIPAFSEWFYILYVAGGISDVMDGWTARRLGEETEAGARLDTVADIVFFGAVLIRLLCEVHFPLWIIVWIIVIAAIKVFGMVIGFVRCHTLVSKHTLLNKITGLMLFAVPLCIGNFLWQPVAILIIATCIVATVASVQELLFILHEHI